MQDKIIIIKIFNLHHFFWTSSFYFKQYLFLKNLLNIMRAIDAMLNFF